MGYRVRQVYRFMDVAFDDGTEIESLSEEALAAYERAVYEQPWPANYKVEDTHLTESDTEVFIEGRGWVTLQELEDA
jgi:hypothetical protein